jgi:L-lysine 2,3-aminomutase
MANGVPYRVPEGPLARPQSPLWAGVPDAQWHDWRWRLRHGVGTAAELSQWIHLKVMELHGLSVTGKFRVDITSYFASLIDPDDPQCPARQAIQPEGWSKRRERDLDIAEDYIVSPAPGVGECE